MKLKIKTNGIVSFTNAKDALIYLTEKLYTSKSDDTLTQQYRSSVLSFLNTPGLVAEDLCFPLPSVCTKEDDTQTYSHFLLHVFNSVGYDSVFTINVIDRLRNIGLFHKNLMSESGSHLVLFAAQSCTPKVLEYLLRRCDVPICDSAGEFIRNPAHSNRALGLPSYINCSGVHDVLQNHILSLTHVKFGDGVAKWAQGRGFSDIVSKFISDNPDRVRTSTKTKSTVITETDITTTTKYKRITETKLVSDGSVLFRSVIRGS